MDLNRRSWTEIAQLPIPKDETGRFKRANFKGNPVETVQNTSQAWVRFDSDLSTESTTQPSKADYQTDQCQSQKDRLLNDLVNELACRLTAISSLLGACQLSLPAEPTSNESLQKVPLHKALTALQVAHQTVDQASQVARSVKSLVRSSNIATNLPCTLNSILDQVALIVSPKLQSSATQFRIEMLTSGAVLGNSSAIIQGLVELIDAMIEEFRNCKSPHRQIKVYATSQGGNFEIFLAGLPHPLSVASPGSPSNSNRYHANWPLASDTRREDLAEKISRDIRANVSITHNARNEHGYRILVTNCRPRQSH